MRTTFKVGELLQESIKLTVNVLEVNLVPKLVNTSINTSAVVGHPARHEPMKEIPRVAGVTTDM